MDKNRNNRYQLIWPGKYRQDGALNTPQPPAHAPKIRYLEEHPGPQGFAGYSGLFVHGDNLDVTHALLPDYAGAIRLIYLDPPFDVGTSFSSEALIGDSGERKRVALDYIDKWDQAEISYAQFMFERLWLTREFLTEDGTLYLHCDYRSNALLRGICDEVFGVGNFRNEIIWHYNSGPRSASDFGRRHDTILRYSRSKNCYFDTDAVREPYSPDINIPDCKAHYYHPDGKVPGDVWDIPIIAQNDKQERAGYATQKPRQLLERIILASSEPGDIVADFFAGSGTTALAARELGRRWVACDVGLQSLAVTRRRLALQQGEAFRIADLGEGDLLPNQSESKLVADLSAQDSDGSVQVALSGYRPSNALFEAAGQRENPLDYVNFWAVDTDYLPDAPFKCCWSTGRTRKNPGLKRVSCPLHINKGAVVCVMAIDVLGQESRTTVQTQ